MSDWYTKQQCCRCRKAPAVRGPYPPMCAECRKIRAKEDAVDAQIARKFDPEKTASKLIREDDHV